MKILPKSWVYKNVIFITHNLMIFLVEILLDSLWTPYGLGNIFYTEFTGVPVDLGALVIF